MKVRFYIFFTLLTALFLFYPGDTTIFKIFAYHRAIFDLNQPKIPQVQHQVPALRFPYYPEVSAEGIYVVDLPSFTPVFSRNEKYQFFPASTTKMMTALVAIDIYRPTDILTVKRPIEEGQVMGLVAREKMTVENLLYGLLVHSGNDAAFVFADNYGFDKFVALMNKKARDLGMNQSHFTNPAGLDDSSQLTTPFELALASRALLAHPELKKIVAIRDITVADTEFKYFHRLANVNKLLGEIQGIGGLKTGYTENAGENLISFYQKDNHQYIIVILKSLDRFADTRQIISWLDTNIDYLSVN